MYWSLHINVHQSIYRAGDTVNGTVHIASQYALGPELDVGSIVVEFTGTSTTSKSWPRLPHTIRLFSLKKTLLVGPKRLHVTNCPGGDTNENEWNFSFTVPTNCDVAERSIFSPSFFNTDSNQSLPASFDDDSVQGGCCSIEYGYQATLLSPTKDGHYTIEACTKKAAIVIDRARNIEQPLYRLNTKSARFTPQLTPLAQGGTSARTPPSYHQGEIETKTTVNRTPPQGCLHSQGGNTISRRYWPTFTAHASYRLRCEHFYRTTTPLPPQESEHSPLQRNIYRGYEKCW